MKFTIPIAPRTKKNSYIPITTKTGKSIMLPSKAYMELERGIKKFIKENFPKCEPIREEINLCCHFYIERDIRSDLVGYLQAIQDALVKAKFLYDDNRKIIKTTNGSEVFLDRKNPRIEVEITYYKKGME